MSSNTRLTRVNEELELVQSAISATLAGNVQSYSTEVQTVARLPLDTLYKRERRLLNEQARLRRGNRFGKIGFSPLT